MCEWRKNRGAGGKRAPDYRMILAGGFAGGFSGGFPIGTAGLFAELFAGLCTRQTSDEGDKRRLITLHAERARKSIFLREK